MKLLLGMLALLVLVVTLWSWSRALPAQREIGSSSPVNALEEPRRSADLVLPEVSASSEAPIPARDPAARRVTVASPFASLEVTVLDVDGAALPGVTVVASPRLDEETRAGKSYTNDGIRFERTDASGKAVISELPPREYEVSCQAANTTATARQRIVLVADEKRRMELQLPAQVLPSICVSGLVLDETGLPLSGIKLRIQIDEGPSFLSAWSDAKGRFERTNATGREIVVSIGNEDDDDDYEPRSRTVPFGACDVVFRRVRVVPIIEVKIVCVDARTGALIPAEGAFYSAERASTETRKVQSMNFLSTKAILRLKDRPDWRLQVSLPDGMHGEASFADSLVRGAKENVVTVRMSEWTESTRNPIEIRTWSQVR